MPIPRYKGLFTSTHNADISARYTDNNKRLNSRRTKFMNLRLFLVITKPTIESHQFDDSFTCRLRRLTAGVAESSSSPIQLQTTLLSQVRMAPHGCRRITCEHTTRRANEASTCHHVIARSNRIVPHRQITIGIASSSHQFSSEMWFFLNWKSLFSTDVKRNN
jgi:hypothetical protein